MSDEAQDVTTEDAAPEAVAEEAAAEAPGQDAPEDEAPVEEPVAEEPSADEPVAEENPADEPVEDAPVAEEAPAEQAQADAPASDDVDDDAPVAAEEAQAGTVSEAFGPVRVARVYVCERGHRTTTLWGEPDTCQARPLRSGPECGLKLYHITELPEQVQKALNPLKASKKASKKK